MALPVYNLMAAERPSSSTLPLRIWHFTSDQVQAMEMVSLHTPYNQPWRSRHVLTMLMGTGQFISAPSLPSIQYFQQNLTNSPSTSPRLPELSLAPPPGPNARQSSQLSLIAASASEMMPNTAFPLEPDVGIATAEVPSRLFDGQPGMGPKSSATWPMPPASPENMFFDQPTEQPPVIEPIAQAQRAQTYPRPIAPNSTSTPQRGFVNDFGTTKSSKPKVRGRFNPIRRKEVQEVRKQGACIRCRMLKKPV
jgi:hypothetical protein